jgi:hypothetical protein
MALSEEREFTAADLAEWTKHLGHKPTAEDWMRAFNSPASVRAQRKYQKEQTKSGKADGRAWAENGRSIAALEAVYNYWTSGEKSEDERIDLLDKMVDEIGEDEEFNTLSDDDMYQDAWYEAVCDVYEEILASW